MYLFSDVVCAKVKSKVTSNFLVFLSVEFFTVVAGYLGINLDNSNKVHR